MFSIASKTGGGSAVSNNDPYFEYVSMLLHGDGTNGALNNTFLDSSTNALTVTRNGNATQGNFVPWNYNYSEYFVGSAAQYVSLPTGLNAQYGALAATTYGAKTTIEFWAYQTATSSTATFFNTGVFGNQNGGSTNGRYAIYMDGTAAGSTQAVTFQYSTSTTTTATVTTTATAPINAWNHIAITIDTTTPSTSTIVIYINGTGQTFSSQNLSTHTTDPNVAFVVGWDQLSDKFTGYLSNFRISRGSSLIYTGNFTPPTQKFLPSTDTKLLLFQNSYLIDDSAYNATITPQTGAAAPTVTQFNPYLNYSLPTPTSYSGVFDANYISFANTTALQMGTGDFTWECWFFPTKLGVSAGLMGLGGTSVGFEIVVTTGNKFQLTMTTTTLTGATTFTFNTWYHVAAVRSGSGVGNVKLYVNGALDATSSTAITDNYNQTTPCYIGAGRTGGGNIFGLLSNARIVKGVAVYTGTFTVPTSPLAATQSSDTNIAAITGTQTSLLTCQSSQFIDNSTFAYVPTTSGTARPIEYNPFGYTTSTALQAYSTTINGGSTYFDGTGDYLSLPNSSALDLATGTPNWTIECWVYLQSSTTLIVLQKDGISGTRQSQYSIGIAGGVWSCVLSPASSSTGNQNFNGTTAYANLWVHLAFVRSGSQIYVFQNGRQVVSTALTIVMGNNTGLPTVGANTSGASPLTGYVSNARIIKGTALYTNSFVPSPTPLTAVTNTQLLLLGTNGAIYDNAVRQLMETSTASISTSVVKFGTGSIAFTGTGYMKYPVTSLFGFGSGDFTVEFWMYVTSTPTSEYEIWESQTTNAFCIYKRGSSSGLSFRAFGGTDRLIQADVNIPLNTWQHVAVARSSGTSNAYINGVRTITITDSSVYAAPVAATPYAMGARATGVNIMPGYIDDFRITLGVARYTGASFTVPSAAFPNQ